MPPSKNFTRQVLQIVSRIPSGKLMTYSSVAKKAGSPRAYRAVGSILNRNYREQEWQLPVIRGQIIPCHRVIRADGQIGNYAKGIKAKEELLEKEGHVVDKHRVLKDSQNFL